MLVIMIIESLATCNYPQCDTKNNTLQLQKVIENMFFMC